MSQDIRSRQDVERLNKSHDEQMAANRLRVQEEDAAIRRELAAEIAARNNPPAPAPVAPVETPAPVAPAVPEPPKEIVFEYQPTDEDGMPIGGKQVVKGTTWEEVSRKVASMHTEATRHIRTLNRKIRLGEVEHEEIPQDAERYDASQFQPRVLSAEERLEITRDINDPEKFDEAADRLLEAKLGARPERIVQTLTQAQQDIAAMRARQEAELFTTAHPEYYKCAKNFQTLTDWMIKYELAPTKSNFELAYERLKGAGLLLEAPIAREESPRVDPPVTPNNTPSVTTPEPARISSEESAQTRRPVMPSSGLSNSNSSSPTADSAQPKRKYSQADIERMSGDEYRRKLQSDPEFRKAVTEIYDTPRAQVINERD